MLQRIYRRAGCPLIVAALIGPASLPLSAQTPDFDRARDRAVRLLQALVRVDTTNPPGSETDVATIVKDVLDAAGIPAHIRARHPARGNLVAHLRGDGSQRPILLMAHTDVVGVERGNWTVDPFGGVIREGHLYGRGASDNKGQLAAMVQVLLLLQRSGLQLTRDVILLAEAGEEGTTEVGIDFMIESHFDDIDAEFALNEGGRMTASEAGITTVSIATTEKVPWRGIRLIARGKGGHGALPQLDNPVVRLAQAVAAVAAYQPPMRLNATTRVYLDRLATISPTDVAFQIRNLETPRLTDLIQQQWRESNIGLSSMLRTTVSPNIINGGFQRNVIPVSAEAELDVRALPDESLNTFLNTLRAVIGDPSIIVTPPTSMRPATRPSPLTSTLFHALEDVQGTMFPRAITLPTMLAAATDSAQLRAKGIQTYGVGMVQDEQSGIHGPNERVSVDALGRFIEYLYRVIVSVAGPGQ